MISQKNGITLYVFIALCLVIVQLHAKKIKIENNTSKPVTMEMASFGTVTGIERYPDLKSVTIGPNKSTTVTVKPYQYMSDLYTPNKEWFNDLSKDYSFGSNQDDRFSIKITTGGKNHLYATINDNSLGKLIQSMAEDPNKTPTDGIEITETDSDTPQLKVTAGNKSELYQSELTQ